MKTEPSDCPHLTDNQVRGLLTTLNQFDYVNIYYENSEHSNWGVEIGVSNFNTIKKQSGWLIKALWAAIEDAIKHKEQEYHEYEQKRKAALSKLTDEDKIILGLK